MQMSPLNMVVITVSAGTPACSQSVSLAAQNSNMRSRTESARPVWAGWSVSPLRSVGLGCDRGRDCDAFMSGAAEGGVAGGRRSPIAHLALANLHVNWIGASFPQALASRHSANAAAPLCFLFGRDTDVAQD
jgi:hypothetical protein